MPQLDPASFTSQLFWLAVSMTVLYVFLSRFFLPPLLGVAETRKETRGSDLSRASALKEEAEAVKAAYEQAMKDARARAQSLFAEVEAQGKQALEQSLAELTRTASRELAAAENRIARQKEELLSSLAPAVAELAALAVEKVTHHRPDAASAQAAVQTVMKG